jgi:hypothetical protein
MTTSRYENLTDQELKAALTHCRAGSKLDALREVAYQRGILPRPEAADAQRGEALLSKTFGSTTRTEF